MMPYNQEGNKYWAKLLVIQFHLLLILILVVLYFSGMLIFISDFHAQHLVFSFVQKSTAFFFFPQNHGTRVYICISWQSNYRCLSWHISLLKGKKKYINHWVIICVLGPQTWYKSLTWKSLKHLHTLFSTWSMDVRSHLFYYFSSDDSFVIFSASFSSRSNFWLDPLVANASFSMRILNRYCWIQNSSGTDIIYPYGYLPT